MLSLGLQANKAFTLMSNQAVADAIASIDDGFVILDAILALMSGFAVTSWFFGAKQETC